MQDGSWTYDQCRLVVLAIALVQPCQPRERLECLSKAHVVGEDTAELHLREVAKEIEAFFLVWPQIGLDRGGEWRVRNALEFAQPIAQRARFGSVRKSLQPRLVERGSLFETDALRDNVKGIQAEI